MPDFDDPLGPLGPYIRPWFPDAEPFDEERDRDGGDFDWDEYGPCDDRLAA